MQAIGSISPSMDADSGPNPSPPEIEAEKHPAPAIKSGILPADEQGEKHAGSTDKETRRHDPSVRMRWGTHGVAQP
ncbi:MAG: hypothetical protein D6795_05100 [Deltaproteobacteria bacterium]|nr:MAG: hypothetical protein D6795_05100 [Deltaproteobacteria bacterium]